MEIHSIDWASAEVEPAGDFYELRVRVKNRGIPTAKWGGLFDREATQHYRHARGGPRGTVTMTGNTVLVQQLESGAEDVLKAHIVELFEATRRMTEPGRAGRAGRSSHPTPASASGRRRI